MGFQYEAEARQMLVHLKERLAKFKLVLHEQKTRLIEFGKLVSELRRKRGAERCETFKFLGFTHYCAWSRDGRFVVMRRTDPKRLTRKLKELRMEARRRMHTPIVLQYQWLCSVLRGHFTYFVCRAILTGLTPSIEKPALFGIVLSIAAANDGSRGSATSGCSNVFPCWSQAVNGRYFPTSLQVMEMGNTSHQ
jgi:hypothetical protein